MDSTNQLEERLQKLEEKFEYQDNTIETLNQVIIDMQKEIDQIREHYSDLKKAVTAIGQSEPIPDVPPPHY